MTALAAALVNVEHLLVMPLLPELMQKLAAGGPRSDWGGPGSARLASISVAGPIES